MHLFAFLLAAVIADFGWLTGGTWSADASALPGGVKEIQTRYEWTPNHAFIRFTTAFITSADSSGAIGYAGDMFYDPKDQQCKIWYVDAKNEITSGTMTLAESAA